MTDEREGIVVLFPENFPDWALTPEERKAKRRLRAVDEPDENTERERDSE